MKKKLYRLLPFFIVVVFIIYWIMNIDMTLKDNDVKIPLLPTPPSLFNKIAGTGWRLFALPFSANDRMYLIIRDKRNNAITDTIELLENISLQKQRHAPFNQHENIIDHLVNHTVLGVKKIANDDMVQLKKTFPSATDSFYKTRLYTDVENNEEGNRLLKTLSNYCQRIIKEKKIDTTGKEWKIVLTQKIIPPFKERNNPPFFNKETFCFETIYKSFNNAQ